MTASYNHASFSKIVFHNLWQLIDFENLVISTNMVLYIALWKLLLIMVLPYRCCVYTGGFGICSGVLSSLRSWPDQRGKEEN